MHYPPASISIRENNDWQFLTREKGHIACVLIILNKLIVDRQEIHVIQDAIVFTIYNIQIELTEQK